MAESLLQLNEWKWFETEARSRIDAEYAAMKSYVSVADYSKASESAGAIRAIESLLAMPQKTARENKSFFDRADEMLKKVLGQ